MREETHWTDFNGKRWKVASPRFRICFRYPANKALRAFVYTRDGFRCVECWWSPDSILDGYDGSYTIIGEEWDGKRQELQIDHIKPLHHGGTHHPNNLQTLCFLCNASKGARHGE